MLRVCQENKTSNCGLHIEIWFPNRHLSMFMFRVADRDKTGIGEKPDFSQLLLARKEEVTGNIKGIEKYKISKRRENK
ncbi:hypothetical protein [Lacrimispora sp.]|uniref:hypothetical protein n=1 Tax=Lacrimispora sp. TaxID=2719234 RepID=UPI0039E70EA4